MFPIHLFPCHGYNDQTSKVQLTRNIEILHCHRKTEMFYKQLCSLDLTKICVALSQTGLDVKLEWAI